jgi:hypothetical protein
MYGGYRFIRKHESYNYDELSHVIFC